MIGRTLGHYRIVEKLGAGGMGEVYRARDERLDRDVAIKVLPAGTLADEDARKRFRREALTLSKLSHPFIATVHEFGTQDGTDFLVMEYVPGDTLAEKVYAGPLSNAEVVRLGLQMAEALEEAHTQGVVHRDLKPANVALTTQGHAKVLDFGIAKLLRSDEEGGEAPTVDALTKTVGVAGTMPYMAPEQLQGKTADARTDLHALGVVLYEMVTGQRPFPATQASQLIAAILQQAPPAPTSLNSQISPELERIILKCLEKAPGDRYQSAKELAVDLRRLGTGTSETIPAPWPAPRSLARWLAWGLAAVTLLAVVVGLNVGGLRDRLFGGAAGGEITTIAVLPLNNLMGDAGQDYFVEGMHQELITQLSKIGALKVISRRSVRRYRDSDLAPGLIAQELGVDNIIVGSVLRDGDKTRVNTELIDGGSGESLWTDSFDRDLTNILSLHKEIARKVAGEIQVALTPDEAVRLTATREVNPKTYEAYLRGMFHLNKHTPEGFERGLAYLHQAVDEDPADPLAYAGLAQGYNIIGHGAAPPPPKNFFPRAEAAARRALELDETLALAHLALAEVEIYYNFNYAEGEKGLLRPVELDPNLEMAHYHYSWFHILFGRWKEGIAEMKQAQELDPLMPAWTGWLGALYMFQGRHEEAIAEARKALEMLPRFPVGLFVLGESYKAQGKYEEAIAVHEQAAAISPAWRWPLGHTYAVAGRREDALKIAAELEKEDRFALGLAEVYVALGRKDDAFRCLETAYEYRHNWVHWLETYPNLKPLRDDPRFDSLLRRMNLRE